MALPKVNRLRKKRDFDRVFKEGNTIKGSFLFIKYGRGDTAVPRFGFVVPAKSFSKAVTRNRIKRALSEIVRKNLKNVNNPKDVMIMVKKGKDKEIIQELSELLLKIYPVRSLARAKSASLKDLG
ncbi:MAG: ribonuclease P protein component [Candidatus Taylorbacteria bacterium]|nr:ribonuclease P protein component [Candidatus Taylorbacteria bacterium]